MFMINDTRWAPPKNGQTRARPAGGGVLPDLWHMTDWIRRKNVRAPNGYRVVALCQCATGPARCKASF